MIHKVFTWKEEQRKKKELIQKLQNSMCAHFLEHTMYNINDALTSILALCDMEEVKAVPRVKGYIKHVNQLLQDLRTYQNNNVFNVNHVLKNVINIIKSNFKQNIKISSSISPVKGLVESSQSKLEQILLFILIELITSDKTEGTTEISIQLHQKDSDAQIIIFRDHYVFSPTVLKEIEELKNDFSGRMQISPQKKGIEISIRMPIRFGIKLTQLPTPPSAASKTPTGKSARKPTATAVSSA